MDVRSVDLLQNFAAARLDAILLNLWHTDGANVVFCQDDLFPLVHAAGADVEQILRQKERRDRTHRFIQAVVTQSQTGSQRHTMDVVGFGGEVSVDVGVGIDPDNAELVSGDAAGQTGNRADSQRVVAADNKGEASLCKAFLARCPPAGDRWQ